MKFHRLTFIASVLLTIVMVVVAVVFDLSKNNFFSDRKAFFGAVFFSVSIMLLANFMVLDQLFKFYGRKQIQRITTILPDEITTSDEGLDFKELGERMQDFSQKSFDEIDTMKEMETYRKEYIGNVSHELKTPLFSIQGYVETLMDGGVENLAIRDKYLDRIDKSVQRLINIVKDLDMINQYESGEISLNYSVFDINSLIRETIDLLDIEIQRKGATAILTSSHPQILVKADKQKISQVLVNLISNAAYYSNRENAKISVKTNVLKNNVLVEVEDNGMGIKAELIPRIFERFYRVESSRSRREGGSGLGLAIVKHILEAHNQQITVESEYLEGTSFRFMLEKS